MKKQTNNAYIYKITCLVTNEFYIGSSNNYNKRITRHKRSLFTNKHHSIKLQNAYNIYGLDNFKFEVIEITTKIDKLIREKFYFETLNPIFNTALDPLAPMEGRKHTPESIEKFKNRDYSCITGSNHYLYGKKMNENHRIAVTNSHIGTKRTEKTKNKMSETAKRINAINRIDRDKQRKKIVDSNGIMYNSLVEAAKITKISIQAICDNLKGRSKKTRKGLIFKYA